MRISLSTVALDSVRRLNHTVNTHNAPSARIRNQFLRVPSLGPYLLSVIRAEGKA